MLRIIFVIFFHFSISPSSVVHKKICVKDLSGTTTPRILKFGTKVGYDLLHCVRENQPPDMYHFLYFSIFLSLQSNFLLQISWLLREPESSNFSYTLRVTEYIVRKKIKMLRIIFIIFFHISISPSSVVHKKICVKDFSGTTAPRILKFGTNVGYDLLHCVRESQPPDMYHFLYFSIFLSLQSNFLLQIFWLLREPESSNFSYPLRVTKYIVGQKTKMLRFIFTILFLFSISHSNVIHGEICVKDFSGTTVPRNLNEIWCKCWV